MCAQRVRHWNRYASPSGTANALYCEHARSLGVALAI